MKLCCLYVGDPQLIDGFKENVMIGIPSGPGATAGFDRVKIVALAENLVAIYCIVPDDFELEEVREETTKVEPTVSEPNPILESYRPIGEKRAN